MSKHLAELCSLIIEATYGELSARIFNTLLTHGRIILPQVIQHSELPPKFVKHGLVVLIQQGLAYYHISTSDGATYYEANIKNAYNLIRSGKCEQMMYEIQESEHDAKDVANLISTIQFQGSVAASDILNAEEAADVEKGLHEERRRAEDHAMTNGDGYGDGDAEADASSNGNDGCPKTNGVNGCHEDDDQLERRRERAAGILLEQGMVVKFRDEDLMSKADFDKLVAQTVKDDKPFSGEVKGTRQTKEYNDAVKVRKLEWIDDNRATLKQLQLGRTNGSLSKRGREEDQAEPGQSAKRRKGNAGSALEASMADSGIGEDVVDKEDSTPSWNAFRVNYDRLQVSQRSLYFHDLAARCFGEDTAKIYLKALQLIERKIKRCQEERINAYEDDDDEEGDETGLDALPDDRTREVTAAEVNDALPDSLELRPMDESRKAKYKQEPLDDLDTTMHEDDEDGPQKRKDRQAMLQRRVGVVEQHLNLLSTSSHKFFTRMSSRGQGSYACDYQAMTRDLMQFEIDALISARFGAAGRRIIRILYEKGKLDEKQLGTIGLMKQKDLRAKLTAMQEAGFVDTQEIPRDNSRQPSRTIYLWFYDQDRVRKLVLNDIYKGMSRLLQRLKVEREQVHLVIEKSERTDVRGNEAKFLSKAEMDALYTWMEVEERLLVQLSRQDDLVALLRDFLPMR